MFPVLAIGNGESRAGIQFANIQTVGCNAIHRDQRVDHLICCDRRMVREALASPNPPTAIYTRPDWVKEFPKVQTVPDLPYKGTHRSDEPFQWGSGPYAVLLAAMLSDQIEMIGFDLDSVDNKVNNVYKGTTNYLGTDARAVDPSYWINQVAKVFTSFPHKYFTIYNTHSWQQPLVWCLDNVKFKTLDLFKYKV
jgi:hypothetical protein